MTPRPAWSGYHAEPHTDADLCPGFPEATRTLPAQLQDQR